MMTPSHFLITAVIAHRIRRANKRVHMGATLMGSVRPDVPLPALDLAIIAYFVMIPIAWRRSRAPAVQPTD